MHSLTWIIPALAIALAAGCERAAPTANVGGEQPAAPEMARDPGSLAFNPDAHPYGASMVEWSKRWWKWEVSIPTELNPSLDPTGEDCAVGQSGHVWFIGATFGSGTVHRECTIPHNRALLVNLSSLFNDYPCPPQFNFEPAPGQSLEDFLTAGARAVEDQVTELSLAVDGVPVPGLFDYRFTTPLFHFTAHPSLREAIDPCMTGTDQVAVADGFYVMLKPLKRGTHTLTFGASTPNVQSSLTYELTVL